MSRCRMREQGFPSGSCAVKLPDGSSKPACEATLKRVGRDWSRAIRSAHLSRPEDYFSIYQSGCNHSCLKCHSWEFSQQFSGTWMSTSEIGELAAKYEEHVTVWEPRSRATMYHATDLCRHCGSCVIAGDPGPLCPGVLNPKQVVLSPQGLGPARNIVAFTGGDIGCCAEFYAQATERIKDSCKRMWVLFETNGYGLTPQNLDLLASAGLDSYWLDIKAFDEETYRKLCGTTNRWILRLPAEILDRGFVLEVLSLFIPGFVETDQLVNIARLLFDVHPGIPFTILAFFPAYKLASTRPPTLKEMLATYFAVKEVGLNNVKLGNCRVFARTLEDMELLTSAIGREGLG